jgi:hypothetical protein
MMRKQLLLMILFLTFVALAASQANRTNNASQQTNKMDMKVHARLLGAYIPAPFTSTGATFASLHSVDQPFHQISEFTATPTITQPPEKKNSAPTRTPRPTATPIPIPPAANPNATSLMILFGLIAVIVVIVGVWLNRSEK